MKTTLKKLPHSTVELTFTLDTDELEKQRDIALDKAIAQVKIPGFRPGKAPKKMAEEHINPAILMQQALDVVLNDAYQEALKEHDLTPVAQPDVDVDSLDISKPIPVKLTVQVRPEAKIGDYHKIKAKKVVEPVTDDKVEETLQTVFERSNASKEPGISNLESSEGGLVDAQGNPLSQKSEAKSQEPVMDNAWAQKLGAKDLADLRTQIRGDLESHAKYEAESKWQEAVLDEVINQTKVDLPEAFIEDELSRMRGHYQQQLSALGVTMDDYLSQAGKTQAEMEEQWRPQAIKQATLEVALAEIAKQENIQITDAEIDEELAKTDSKTQAQFEDPQQRYYLSYTLWRQKVLKHIISQIEANQK